MTKVGQKGTTALMAALVMLGAGPAGAQDEPKVRSEQREAIIYAGIGVRTVWVDSEQAVGKHLDGGLHLTVMLLPREIAGRKISVEGLSIDALGRARPGIGRAYIFCDRVASMPGPKFFAIQLGAVIAHEVGHLVLPEKSHWRHGIMRAEMDAPHAIHQHSFEKTQADMIRSTLMKPSTVTGGEESGRHSESLFQRRVPVEDDSDGHLCARKAWRSLSARESAA